MKGYLRKDVPVRMRRGELILQCPPCSWNMCVFCGYSMDCLVGIQPSTNEFLNQLQLYLSKWGDEDYLEIYNSGSFLDDEQISEETRIALFNRLSEVGIKDVVIESRPEFVVRDKLDPLIRVFKGKLTVGIGLEVADDFILKKLKKGFMLKDVGNALNILNNLGVSSRAYILVGPPFVEDPLKSALDSVNYAKDVGFSELVLLAAYPMKGSEGYDLWMTGKWTPINKKEFDHIIIKVRKIEPKIEYSFKDFEGE